MDLVARDAANTCLEIRDGEAPGEWAFDAALRVYRLHFSIRSDDAAHPLVAQIIPEAENARGRGR